MLIKWTKPSDAGTYTVTATNEVGEVSSSATLFIKSGECYTVKLFLHTGGMLLCCWLLVGIPTQPLDQVTDLLFTAFVFIAKKLNSAQDCGNHQWLPSLMSLQISMKMKEYRFLRHSMCARMPLHLFRRQLLGFLIFYV